MQAQRGDVHAVLVNGRIGKRDHPLVGVENTVEHLRKALGDEAWEQGMNPDVPTTAVLDNPYTYTDCRSESTHGG